MIGFGINNFYYINSQYRLYTSHQNEAFTSYSQTIPVLAKLESERAAAHLLPGTSKKILLIVNESWGQPQNEALQADVLAALLQQKSRFSDFKSGSFHFSGATVEGELRELCAYGQAKGFAFRHLPQHKFETCLPNQLKQKGYHTVALHGANGLLYDRYDWYPKAGFKQVVTGEHLIGRPTCKPFNGICDTALFQDVGNAFATHDKLFFYWLTLTTHATYNESDLITPRLDCEKHGLPKDTMLCRNFRLQAQFFDHLAKLLARPEMKGTEVLVVGDHIPPVINLGENMKYMESNQVSWVYFKIKE